jgi:transcriptional regulator with XRE-family HTH domain
MSKKPTEFGRLCRSYRAKLGLNMKQAVEKLGIAQPTLTRIELGELPPPFEFIIKSIDAYEIKDRTEQMSFLLSYLKSSERFEIPLEIFGPLRKELLAALCTFRDVRKNNREELDELKDWVNKFSAKLNDIKEPPYTVLGEDQSI